MKCNEIYNTKTELRNHYSHVRFTSYLLGLKVFVLMTALTYVLTWSEIWL